MLERLEDLIRERDQLELQSFEINREIEAETKSRLIEEIENVIINKEEPKDWMFKETSLHHTVTSFKKWGENSVEQQLQPIYAKRPCTERTQSN